MTNVNLNVYNVGHGVCALLTGDKSDGNKYCGLFDCGSIAANWRVSSDPGFVRSRLIEEIRAIGHIDDIVISHQDADHHNWLWDVIVKLNDFKGDIFNNKHFGTAGQKVYCARFSSHSLDLCKTIYSNGKPGAYSFQSVFYIPDMFNESYCTKDFKAIYDLNWQLMGIRIKLENLPLVGRFDIQVENCMSPGRTVFSLNNGKKEEFDEWDSKQLVDILSGKYALTYRTAISIKNEVQRWLVWSEGGEIDFRKSLLQSKYAKMPSVPIRRIMFGGGNIEAGYRCLQEVMHAMQALMGNSFAKGTGYFKLCETGGQKLRNLEIAKNILDHNGEISAKQTNIIRNATSVVTRFFLDIKVPDTPTILFPGDATVHVFDELRECIVKPENIAVILAPHHGSDHTNIAYCIPKRGQVAYCDTQPLIQLLSSMGNYTMFVSASDARYDHPGKYFVHIAEQCTNVIVDKHAVFEREDCDEDDGNMTDKAIYVTQRYTEAMLSWPLPVIRSKSCENSTETGEAYDGGDRADRADLPPDDCFI